MEDQSNTNELHPEIAFQIGAPVERKKYDIHPSLQAELEPSEQPPVQEETIEVQTETEDIPEQPEHKPEPIQAAQEEPKRDWREYRAKDEEARMLAREKEQLQRELEFYKTQQVKAADTQEDDYRTDTEKRLEREMHELKQQIARQAQETEAAKKQVAVSRAEQRLAQEYPNIREVVSDENIRRLEIEYPHLYNSVVSSSDVYTVGAAAYEMIVAKGIYKKPVSAIKQLTQSNSVARNQSKPRSVSTVSPQSGESPIKQASAWMGNSISSEEERKALYEEMRSASRNIL